jgi:hypothetical protein
VKLINRTRSVAAVLSSFVKMKDELEAIAGAEVDASASAKSKAAELLSKADEHMAEATRARKAATAINQIIGG